MLKPPHKTYDRLFVYHLDITVPPVVADPDFIGAWQEGDTVVLFFHCNKNELVENICRKHQCKVVYEADLDYTDWEAGSEIVSFTAQDLTIAPVWENIDADIQIDPSVIFGSGFHSSTRLCLESMLTLLNDDSMPIKAMYDLGCGTGLLSLCAAAKGVEKVLAIDYNGLACQVAKANIIRNKFDTTIEVQQQDLFKNLPPIKNTDLVIANLHHELLVHLFQREDFWTAKYYIISGYIVFREDDLLKNLPAGKVRLISRERQEKWGIWCLQNKEI